MKAIVNTAPGQLTWQEVPLPEPGPGQVRIRTAACGICATDLHMVAGWERTGFPSIPGHEWSGWVDAAGPGVDPRLVGRPCVAENVLSDGGEVGFEHPGGYAQYLVSEAQNVYTLPPGFPLRQAALIEPLAVVVHGLKRLGAAGAERPHPPRALVFGDGPIGLISLILLRHRGAAEVCLVGGREPRLALAQSLGASAALNYHACGPDLAGAISALDPRPYSLVIEASGSSAALAASLDVTAREGSILVMGDYGSGQAGFYWNTLLHRELALVGSNASAGAWREAVDLAASAALPLERLISHHFPAQDFQQGYELVREPGSEVIKVILEWPQ